MIFQLFMHTKLKNIQLLQVVDFSFIHIFAFISFTIQDTNVSNDAPMYSQSQYFTDSVFDFLCKQLISGQNWCISGIPYSFLSTVKSLLGFCYLQAIPEFNCIDRNENTEAVKFCGWVYLSDVSVIIDIKHHLSTLVS